MNNNINNFDWQEFLMGFASKTPKEKEIAKDNPALIELLKQTRELKEKYRLKEK